MSTNQPQKINVNSSTLVDLKAELLRKQQEFRKQKSKGGLPVSERRVKNAKPKEKDSIWSKTNAGVLERAQRDIEARKEEDATLEKSRSTLEAKAKLYEKITNSNDIPEDDDGELFLVDFQRKAQNDRLQERLEQRAIQEKQDVQETSKSLSEPAPEAKVPEDEWVDYVDQFGKSRRCLRKDLEDLKGQVKPLKISGEAELLSEDMKRELLRQKWEQEEEEMLNGPTGPVHYSNVQFDEIRSHGVAYYQFSKDEEERKSQMEKLQQLREQTLEQRDKKERLKEKRKAIMAARLAKVKQRRMITSTIDSDSDEKEEVPEEKAEVKVVEPIVRDDSWRKSAPVREWDKGKKADMDWFHHQRKERDMDFAPPSFYYEPSSASISSQRPATSSSQKDKVPESGDSVQLEVDAMLNQIRTVSDSGAPPNNSSSVADIPLPQEKDSDSAIAHQVQSVPMSDTMYQSNVPAPPGVYCDNQWIMPPGGSNDHQTESQGSGYMTGYQYYGSPVDQYAQADTLQNPNLVPESQAVSESQTVQNENYLCAIASEDDTVNSQQVSKDSLGSSSVKGAQATYSSQPVKYARPGMQLGQQEDGSIVTTAPQKIAYQRVHIHQLPRSLPVPPSLSNKPSYPSQENVLAISEKKAEKNWMKQYGVLQNQGHDSKKTLPKTDKIPFPSPYVQKAENSQEPFKSDVSYDPSKPPPSIGKD